MLGTKEIIQEAYCLPVEDRALVIDSLLRSLNFSESFIEDKWMVVAKRRLAELRSGQVKPVPGEQVFARVRDALAR